MKLPAVLLAGSLAANAALVATCLRPSLAPAGIRDYLAGTPSLASVRKMPKPVISADVSVEDAKGKPEGPPPSLWSSFAQNDLKKLVSQLRAAGFPPYAIRVIVEDRLRDDYTRRTRQLTDPDPHTPYLKAGVGQMTPERFNELRRLNDEHEQILHDLLGVLASRDTDKITSNERRYYGNLSAEEMDSVRRIERDYEEMSSQLRESMENIVLPEDKERLALLEREKHADLAAILTPEEMEGYDMRHSPVTGRLGGTMTIFHPSESEFRAIYQIEAPLEAVLYPQSPGSQSMDTISAAQREMNDQLKAALGEQRYAELTQSADREYGLLVSLERQQNLSPGSAGQAYVLRDRVAQESNRIFQDDSLDIGQKRVALQTLAQSTRTQLITTLGPVAGDTYLQGGAWWLKEVEKGSAVSFVLTPQGTMTTYHSLSSLPSAGAAAESAKP